LPSIITIVNYDNYNKNIIIGLDISVKHTNNENLYWIISKKRLFAKIDNCFPTKSIMFKNKKIKIPNNEEKYLEELYGNWKTPVKQWTYEQYSNIDNHSSYEE
jgi:phosphorylcholine metabolism protein LicD